MCECESVKQNKVNTNINTKREYESESFILLSHLTRSLFPDESDHKFSPNIKTVIIVCFLVFSNMLFKKSFHVISCSVQISCTTFDRFYGLLESSFNSSDIALFKEVLYVLSFFLTREFLSNSILKTSVQKQYTHTHTHTKHTLNTHTKHTKHTHTLNTLNTLNTHIN
jgi:hypothetical protein